MSGFGVTADRVEQEEEYDISDNFFEDFVRFSRSQQVLNEEQSMVVEMAIATGMLNDYSFYTSIIVTGSSAGGKSHMLDEVNMESLEYANEVSGGELLYELTGGSDKAGIDDEDIDLAYVAYFHELQKIPDEMLEFIKTVSEDGQFKYGRNVPDPKAHGGRSTAHIERDPLPVIFSFADENDAAAGNDQELRTRTVEVKVDEDPEKNAAVHDMKWGGEQITLPRSDHEYVFDAPDLHHAIKSHIRDMPKGVDAIIPYGRGNFEGDDWRAAEVVKPMFNFGRTQSTRASANLAGLTMGSAVLNYHNRDAACLSCGRRYDPEQAQEHEYTCPECSTADEDQPLKIVVEPTDVANVIACRPTLLATTHGLTEKKFAVLDAIRERGGQANPSGTAVQATKQDIISEIQDNDDIATLTKSEVEDILKELDETLIINKKDNPEDRRENLYVYDGAAVFGAPDIYGDDGELYDRFKDIEDPIRKQPIEQTIEEHLEDLNAKMQMQSLDGAVETAADAMGGSEGANSGLSSFGDDSGASDTELSETAEAVAERLQETVGGCTVPQDVFEENTLKTSHMVGDTPIERDGDTVVPARKPTGDDRMHGFMSPSHDNWDDDMSFDEVEAAIEKAIEELRSEGVLVFEHVDGGIAIEIER